LAQAILAQIPKGTMTYLSEILEKDKKDEDTREDDDDAGDVTFDQAPVSVVCPHCGLSVITYTEHEASWVTYLVALAMLLVLGWAAICVIPITFPLFKDVVHHCPRCLNVLATRSRVVLPSFRQEVMSFRFGSCVVVLNRKYVLTLLCLFGIIGGIHFVRTSSVSSVATDNFTRGEVMSQSWEDFTRDCGFKSYLGNPIHVNMAFKDKYRNKTFHWEGVSHHLEEGFSLLWFNQRGALYVRMNPPQFPSKRDAPDVVLLYNEAEEVARKVEKLKRGAEFAFDATMMEVGKRGAPHVMLLWELHPSLGSPKAAASGAAPGTSAPEVRLASSQEGQNPGQNVSDTHGSS